MIAQDYDEPSCENSANRWENSQIRYHQIADRLSQVRERIALDNGDWNSRNNRSDRNTNDSDDAYRSPSIGPFAVGSH